jgi:subtilase family serine protease
VLIYPGNETSPFPTNTGTPIGTSCVASGDTTINGPAGPSGQEVFFTPDQVSQAYAMGGLQRKYGASASSDVALISFNGGFLSSDVQDAANCFGHRAPDVRVTRGTGVGAPFNNVDGETSLDLQTAAWVLKNARSLRLVQVTNSATSYLDGYSRLLTDPAGPPVSASLSYGSCEPGSNSVPGWRTQDDLFALAGVLGTSLFVSAGDTGSAVCQVGDLVGVDMLAESIVAALGESNVPQAVIDYLLEVAQSAAQQSASPASTVSYPASSPWVTAVGATQLVLGDQNSIVRESPWNDLQYGVNGNAVTTGGPSMIYARPWYQPSFTAADRRLVPDIAAMGALTPAMPLYVSGQLGIVAGTSESSPMMAAAMALVSKQRESAGKEPLGFINPWLYRTAQSHPSVFRDITDGNNQYPVQYAPDSLNVVGCCEAVEGFDTASGLGSINFERLAKVAR